MSACAVGIVRAFAQHQPAETVEVVLVRQHSAETREHRRRLPGCERPVAPDVAHDRLRFFVAAGVAKSGGKREPTADGQRLDLVIEGQHRLAAWPKRVKRLFGAELQPLRLGPARMRFEDVDDLRRRHAGIGLAGDQPVDQRRHHRIFMRRRQLPRFRVGAVIDGVERGAEGEIRSETIELRGKQPRGIRGAELRARAGQRRTVVGRLRRTRSFGRRLGRFRRLRRSR